MMYELFKQQVAVLNAATGKGPLFVLSDSVERKRIENSVTVVVSFAPAGVPAGAIKMYKQHAWPSSKDPDDYNEKVDQLRDDCTAAILGVLLMKGLRAWNMEQQKERQCRRDGYYTET